METSGVLRSLLAAASDLGKHLQLHTPVNLGVCKPLMHNSCSPVLSLPNCCRSARQAVCIVHQCRRCCVKAMLMPMAINTRTGAQQEWKLKTLHYGRYDDHDIFQQTL